QQGAAMLEAVLAPSSLDKDAAHGFRCRGEEVVAATPVLTATFTDQAQVGLVDQGRRLQRLSRGFVAQAVARQPGQLLVDEREELRRGLRVAGLDGIQQNSDVFGRGDRGRRRLLAVLPFLFLCSRHWSPFLSRKSSRCFEDGQICDFLGGAGNPRSGRWPQTTRERLPRAGC